MSRFFLYMVGLGIAVLVSAAVMLLRPPAPGSSSLMEPPGGRHVGNTAISHGGPGASPPAAPVGPGSSELGKAVIVVRDTSLLSAVPAAPDAEPLRGTAPVPAGTMVTIVAIAPAVPSDTAQGETFYKVRLKDGLAGWVAEHELRSTEERSH
jgi:hypothetical protein